MTEADAAVAPNHEKKTRVNTVVLWVQMAKTIVARSPDPVLPAGTRNYAVAH